MNKPKDTEKTFAQIKYVGKLVEEGYLDVKKAGQVLLNIDEMLRYFLYEEDKKFKKIDFEIPVRIKKGSWVTEIIANIDTLLISGALTWGGTKYFGTALTEMAKADFKDVGFKDIFKKIFQGLTWVLKIAKHLGTLSNKKIYNYEFAKNTEFVILTNNEGNKLEVPVKYLEMFVNCPNDLFEKLATIIEKERELEIIYNDLENNSTDKVKIGYESKNIFIANNDDDEILFPELKHNDFVELSGHITRGNEKSNTVGFMYEGHILTCYPSEGNIKDFKNTLFTNCTIKGFVDRIHKKTGEIIEKRPRIKFTEIISNNSNQTKLF